MRALHAVSAAILTAALASPAALAQSDARENYGPLAATRGKPEPKANAAKPAIAKPAIAKPATATPTAAQPTTAKPAAPPQAAAARKPVETASAPAPQASEIATDGRSASGKKVRTAKGKLAATGKHAARKSAAGKPAAGKAAAGKAAASKPAAGKAVASKPAAAKAAVGKPETASSLSAAGAEKQSALRDAYMALPPADRLAIQLNLIWTGDYRGFADGEFSDRLVEATKEYQKRNKLKVTGLLAPEERAALAAAVGPRQDYAGWRMVEDPVTGARLGIPTRFATHVTPGPSGTRWSSEQGQLQIETFRIETGATLEAVFEQQKKMPRRRVSGSNLLGDSFVISGMQGLKKMRVVGFARGGEVRGLTILYDQAMEGSIDPLVLPISGAYLPFAQGVALAAAAEAPRRKVEYGTGVFVSAAGHALTDRALVDGCQIITLPGIGHAERVAEDRLTGLALLRINGVSGIAAAPLAGDDEAADQVTLVGVVDPTSQAGGGAVSTAKARMGVAAGEAKMLDQAPALGFAGAGAFNASGRLVGLVQLQPVQTSGAMPASAKAAVVSAGTIRRFLQQQGVANSEAALEEVQSAVTRVICVRK